MGFRTILKGLHLSFLPFSVHLIVFVLLLSTVIERRCSSLPLDFSLLQLAYTRCFRLILAWCSLLCVLYQIYIFPFWGCLLWVLYWIYIFHFSFLQPAGGQSNILFGEEPVVKTSKKIHNQKFAELTGNDIFKGDVPPGSAEKPLSNAKLREMSGSNIFADEKVESRDYFGGVRKPPGGESSISLV